MDNFDHGENTISGKHGSHDTILMLFQNNDVDKRPQDIIRNVPENLKTTEDERKLHYILPCQLINKARNLGKRGEIADDFVPAGELIDMKQKISRDHFLIWSATRSKPQNTTIRTVFSSSQQFLRCETECNYKIYIYSYHTSSSNQVRYNIYIYEEFPRCSSKKGFGVWSPMVQ